MRSHARPRLCCIRMLKSAAHGLLRGSLLLRALAATAAELVEGSKRCKAVVGGCALRRLQALLEEMLQLIAAACQHGLTEAVTKAGRLLLLLAGRCERRCRLLSRLHQGRFDVRSWQWNRGSAIVGPKARMDASGGHLRRHCGTCAKAQAEEVSSRIMARVSHNLHAKAAYACEGLSLGHAWTAKIQASKAFHDVVLSIGNLCCPISSCVDVLGCDRGGCAWNIKAKQLQAAHAVGTETAGSTTGASDCADGNGGRDSLRCAGSATEVQVKQTHAWCTASIAAKFGNPQGL
mmetsp:Transcript_2206/g.6257  ORF Transcript_2206/g.6257 Transcript_2206/m.6257 type:complete len:291 (-) Transcript_2206:710-1582(-)